MENRCNFKIERFGKLMHVHSLEVVCRRDNKGIYYAVKGYANENTVSIAQNSSRHTELFDTPEEAFAFLDKIIAKYPRYDDIRDLDIDLAPLYESVEDEPIRTKVCQKEKEPAPTDIGTSSKENNHDISITDNPVNVNTPEKIPEIVLEALTDTLEDLYHQKREITEVIENLKKRLDMECEHFRDTMEKIATLKKYIRSIGYGDVLTAIDSEQERGKEAGV